MRNERNIFLPHFVVEILILHSSSVTEIIAYTNDEFAENIGGCVPLKD